ncbi:5-oxoprolinase subunit B family protein [Phocicoccus pinnipedialis]|uniref:Kinase A inhibitor n=1 Tax=Phocicoccus pinnipedialis TaxID=110845 RepID=A0A6V7RA78_9BACL|nr:allophanate hydrolase subunit 1 [Jeotgalicoccus pinnipedialis]MBP1940177.1 inhibitor of KinA [Jeotgalicoccus pinnipedialis]CAD2073868.1 Kinase A inhibitor [Jeotgalicoccus pinnipedialis]
MIIKEISEDRLVIFQDKHTYTDRQHEVLISLMYKIEDSKLPLLNVNVSYNSVTVQWDIFKVDVETVKKNLLTICESLEDLDIKVTKKNIIEIPVCYDPEFGIDQDKFAVSLEELINRHTEPEYRVYMIGFLPGFMYLGGLDEKLHMKRLVIPRKKIDKGSVGIAGGQTGVYPQIAPGGWNIIGKTPLEMVKEGIPIVNPGDYVKFYSISKDEYWRLYNDKDN